MTEEDGSARVGAIFDRPRADDIRPYNRIMVRHDGRAMPAPTEETVGMTIGRPQKETPPAVLMDSHLPCEGRLWGGGMWNA